MNLRAVNEWDALHTVVVGTAQSWNTPSQSAYDPKSEEHIRAGTFPVEVDCMSELDGLAAC